MWYWFMALYLVAGFVLIAIVQRWKARQERNDAKVMKNFSEAQKQAKRLDDTDWLKDVDDERKTFKRKVMD